ncbi:sarcosine oxidase [Candidatus Pelagibacter sp.]|nr:sarcosine oxidase [Candidatus Pelagibacter sp.]
MTLLSPLENIHKKGIFGDYENKNENDLITIKEKKFLYISQIVQYKNSSATLKDIDGLNLSDEALKVSSNKETRILWTGPKNWILTTTKKDLLKDINRIFNEADFAITDLSHSKTVIEIEGKFLREVLKKGCPFNFNDLKKNNCVNSLFNGITVTIDMINDNPDMARIFTLRSFGQSLYESISDSCLEFGYRCI